MKSSPFVIWFIGCVLGCGSSKPAASQVRDGSDLELTDCTLLDKVKGTSNDADNDVAERNAKNAARAEAAALGATHIRWLVPCCTSVEGDAYRCDQPDLE